MINILFTELFIDSVAQLVEQWPFKPLAVSSSLTRVTRRQNTSCLYKPLDNFGGFLVFNPTSYNHTISKVELPAKPLNN